MSKTRTTIYLDDDYKQLLKTIGKKTDMNNSEIIRNALDIYLASDQLDFEYKKKKMREKLSMDY